MSKIRASKITYIIIYSLGILGLLALSGITPLVAHAQYSERFSNGTLRPNPRPYLTSIYPDESLDGTIPPTITITGRDFVPTSIARVNGINQRTTFIDQRNLLVNVNPADTESTRGEFFITVFNPSPAGGYSNAKKFKVPVDLTTNRYPEGTNTSYVKDGYYSENSQQNIPSNIQPTRSDAYKNLAAASIFGAKSIFPSGAIQWILVAIIVLLIVILIRKAFGYRDAYIHSPLKHD